MKHPPQPLPPPTRPPFTTFLRRLGFHTQLPRHTHTHLHRRPHLKREADREGLLATGPTYLLPALSPPDAVPAPPPPPGQARPQQQHRRGVPKASGDGARSAGRAARVACARARPPPPPVQCLRRRLGAAAAAAAASSARHNTMTTSRRCGCCRRRRRRRFLLAGSGAGDGKAAGKGPSGATRGRYCGIPGSPLRLSKSALTHRSTARWRWWSCCCSRRLFPPGSSPPYWSARSQGKWLPALALPRRREGEKQKSGKRNAAAATGSRHAG